MALMLLGRILDIYLITFIGQLIWLSSSILLIVRSAQMKKIKLVGSARMRNKVLAKSAKKERTKRIKWIKKTNRGVCIQRFGSVA
jgi:hypothetical protein